MGQETSCNIIEPIKTQSCEVLSVLGAGVFLVLVALADVVLDFVLVVFLVGAFLV